MACGLFWMHARGVGFTECGTLNPVRTPFLLVQCVNNGITMPSKPHIDNVNAYDIKEQQLLPLANFTNPEINHVMRSCDKTISPSPIPANRLLILVVETLK